MVVPTTLPGRGSLESDNRTLVKKQASDRRPRALLHGIATLLLAVSEAAALLWYFTLRPTSVTINMKKLRRSSPWSQGNASRWSSSSEISGALEVSEFADFTTTVYVKGRSLVA